MDEKRMGVHHCGRKTMLPQTRHKSVEVARRYMRSADLWRNNVTEKVMRRT